jgi:hypothetical protein
MSASVAGEEKPWYLVLLFASPESTHLVSHVWRLRPGEVR